MRYSYSQQNLAEGLINFFVGLAEILLGLRVIFRLLDAHASVHFVQWVYNTSGTLMLPFRNIFTPSVISPGYVIDFSALFAMAIYAAAGYLLLGLLSSFVSARK